jgi:hypothetical protein
MISQLALCDYVCLIVLHRHELEEGNIRNVKFCYAKAKGRRYKWFLGFEMFGKQNYFHSFFPTIMRWYMKKTTSVTCVNENV